MHTNATGRIARAAARRPWFTLLAWAVLLTAAVISAGTIGDYVTPSQSNLVTTEADRAQSIDHAHRLTSAGDRFSEQVVIQSDAYSYGDPEFDAVTAAAADAIRGIEGVSDVVTPAQGAPVAATGHAAIVTFSVPGDTGVLQDAMDAVDAVATEDVDAFVYGPESVGLALNDLANESLARGEGIGIAVALVVLMFVFGALVAAGLPLLVALVSIISATGISALVARILDANGVEVSDSITIFAGMMGLALGIDYSLLTVQRFREELARGASVVDAVTTTGATANRAVLVSGGTVVVSIGGLLFLPLNTFLGVGLAIIAVASSSVATALFLLPAVLRLLGHRVNSVRLPWQKPGHESLRWKRLATWVADRPGRASALGLIALLVLASPLVTLRFAQPSPEAWPEDFLLHRANDVYVTDFGWTDSATLVAIEGAGSDRAAIDALASAMEADEGFGGVTVDWAGDVAFIDAYDTFALDEAESADAIDRLRDTLVPAALGGTDAEASVGGARAAELDTQTLMRHASPWAVGFILTATFILLLVMFRSIVVPLKALVMNILGTAATFGAMVAVFQWGWGSALGLPEIDGVSPYMPVMVFALVFGLSMDYHVFLLSRIKERYDATGDNRAAVIEGLTRTGPLITGAALIMIGVFGGFAIADIPELSQWGFGLAAGVLIDATIIRVLLVPAAMMWLGHANWYLPRWLDWLPRFEHEAPAPVAVTASAEAIDGDPEDEREPALV